MSENLTEQAKLIIKDCKGFIEANNYEVLKVEENYCELLGRTSPTSTNHFKTIHGGYIFGLADTAAGIAAMTDGRTAVTVSSNINYLKSTTTDLTAIAKCTKSGKNMSFFEVKIYDIEKKLVATATVNYMYITK